ncbi:MAG: twin-arginine translocase TatA/TatE family subunit [Tepidisphaeraceae bacterium]
MHLPLAAIWGPDNWLIIAVVALLLFGKRLPEVGRSLGKGIIEFKKGLAGIEDDIDQAVHKSSQPTTASGDRTALPSNYKFDPYTGKPLTPEEPATPQMRFDPYTGKPLT